MDDLRTVYTLFKTYGFRRPKPSTFAPPEFIDDIIDECCQFSFGFLVERELDNIRFEHPDLIPKKHLVVWIIRQLEMTYEGNIDDLWNECEHKPLKILLDYNPDDDLDCISNDNNKANV